MSSLSILTVASTVLAGTQGMDSVESLRPCIATVEVSSGINISVSSLSIPTVVSTVSVTMSAGTKGMDSTEFLRSDIVLQEGLSFSSGDIAATTRESAAK